MRTAVLVHGQHVLSKEWETVMWGNPQKGIYGRIAAGLREALRFDAEVIFFGTGASEKDGMKEGALSLLLAQKHITEMPEFSSMEPDKALAWLDERATLELTSQNTATEI